MKRRDVNDQSVWRMSFNGYHNRNQGWARQKRMHAKTFSRVQQRLTKEYTYLLLITVGIHTNFLIDFISSMIYRDNSHLCQVS